MKTSFLLLERPFIAPQLLIQNFTEQKFGRWMSEKPEEMEGRTAGQKGGVVPSQLNGKEPAPRNKGNWRGRNRRGHNNGRYPNQEHYRQQRDSSDKRDGFNQPQRRGAMPDRRPPARSFYQASVDSKRESVSDVLQDNPVTSPSAGSKKYGMSLNHLLNFKYAPREKPLAYLPRNSRKKYTPFNKEQFIQANFQFVVSDSGDYTVHCMDPDVLVEWDLIEQVRIFSHEVPSCPICLYPPVAAKITRCGHIYCWSCILHYLSLSDNSWHKCPICFEAVHKKNLKSVVAMESHPFSVGDTITMRLMMRAKNSVLAIPKAQWHERELKPFGINDKEDTCYAKLLQASPDEVLKQIIDPEETALDTQLVEAKSEQSEEVCYIEVALEEIKARRESLSESKDCAEEVRSLMESVLHSDEDDQKDGQEVTSWKVLSPSAIQDVGDYEAAFSDEEEEAQGGEQGSVELGSAYNVTDSSAEETFKTTEIVEDFNDATNDKKTREHSSESTSGDSGSESSRPLSPGPVSTQYYYFYQADDGQNVFLSPINARCLIKEYGSLENCPEYITAQIVEMDALTQSETLRKQYRYMSHLPLTCEFVICELDIKPPVVSRQTLNFFREELQRRKQQRQKKLRMEKRREHKIASSSSYSSGRFTSRSLVPDHLDLGSDLEFPAQAGPLAFSPPSNSSPSPFMQFAASMAGQDEGSSAIAESDGTNLQDNLGPNPPSFAEALRSKKAVDIPKRTEKPTATASVRKNVTSVEDEDEEDCAPVPTFKSAFTEALGAADWTGSGVNLEGQGATGERNSGKKQKKNKKKLLFTTGSFMKYS